MQNENMMLAALLTISLGSVAAAPMQTAAPPDQLLTAAALEKLKAVTLGPNNKTSTLAAPVVKMLGIGKDGDTVTVKQFKAETAQGLYILTIPVNPASDDVIFSFRDPSGVTYNYLSDSSRTLHAAMASDADGNRTVKNAEAQEGFLAVLKDWGLIAPECRR